MRTLSVLVIAFVSSGCLLETVTVTATQGELAAESARSANETLNTAKDTQHVIELQSAVRTYNGLHGHYPATLDELAPSVLAEVPKQSDGRSFKYDPVSGTVTIYRGAEQDTPSLPQPIPHVTQQDLQNLELIAAAIYRYWEVTGRYPENLESLAPDYMATVPTMSNGAPYVYNVQTGAVNHPRELMAAPPASQPVSGGNNPSGISGQNTNRQVKVMNELGL